MSRIARVVVPGVPHHVTQCGNRRMDILFSDKDRQAYLDLLREFGNKHGVRYRGCGLISSHVDLIAVPQTEQSLAQGIGLAHKACTRLINFRENWRGYLWQGRFFSCPLDEAHAQQALRYVEPNPVRVNLVERAEDWAWSSQFDRLTAGARGHVTGRPDGLTDAPPFWTTAERGEPGSRRAHPMKRRTRRADISRPATPSARRHSWSRPRTRSDAC